LVSHTINSISLQINQQTTNKNNNVNYSMSPLNNEIVTPVYIKSAENSWVPALQLKRHNGKATVAVPKYKNEQEMLQCGKKSRIYKYHDNQIIDLKDYANNALPMQNVDSSGNVEDYMELKDLPFMHEAAILYNLKLRHTREKPYTRAGDIVMAVNPYQWLNELYTEEKRSYYSNRLVWERSDEDPRDIMQPHIYEVSALAYKGLAFGDEECNQSILVSGESGAGTLLFMLWCNLLACFHSFKQILTPTID